MLKTLILSLTILTTDTLPPTNQLLTQIDSFYQVKTNTELLEYQTSQKGEWLKYLPTVGLQYTLDGKPRPTLSFSSSIIYKANKDKQSLHAKRFAIIEKNQREASITKLQLLEKILEYQLLQRALLDKEEIFQIDSLLFRLDQKRYENLEMAPSEFLQAKKRYLLQAKAIRDHQARLLMLRTKILQFAHYQSKASVQMEYENW